ncbi:MAG: spermidine synthase, partial [Acidobacteriota bacterium]
RGGTLVTQATSPFFSKDAFLCILKTMRSAGIPSVALHNHIPTMGEWGWVLGFNAPEVSDAALKQRLSEQSFQGFETRFLNQEAMLHMLHFGKGVLDRLEGIEVNQELNLALYNYYQQGEWDLY